MVERGNTKHGPRLDEEIEQETSGMIGGTQPAHVEEFRQTEAFADDTDPAAVQEAAGTVDPVADAPDAGEGEEDR